LDRVVFLWKTLRARCSQISEVAACTNRAKIHLLAPPFNRIWIPSLHVLVHGCFKSSTSTILFDKLKIFSACNHRAHLALGICCPCLKKAIEWLWMRCTWPRGPLCPSHPAVVWEESAGHWGFV
jgi:hypothetical protein